ncbi:MAG: hypothetical protein HOV80_26390 [Polyangiaceae bacterium]|nr:hypothetical protein [Polyangiaceae bacterium]
MRVVDVSRMRCFQGAGGPVLRPRWGSTGIVEPTFVPPHESHDRRWHLFAREGEAVFHHVSEDGVVWERLRGAAIEGAARPFLLIEPDGYVLFYERVARRRAPASSWIEAMVSRDLMTWSSPRAVLSPTLSWHASGQLGRGVGSPSCLRLRDGRYALYYGAGLVVLDDCRLVEPRAFGVAFGPSPLGPFTSIDAPLLEPDAADAGANLAAGTARVLALEDGFVALQCGVYTDERGRSRAAVRALASADGEAFSSLSDTPVLAPGIGFMRSHVRSLDARRVGGRLRVYFQARSAWHRAIARESIGMADLA